MNTKQTVVCLIVMLVMLAKASNARSTEEDWEDDKALDTRRALENLMRKRAKSDSCGEAYVSCHYNKECCSGLCIDGDATSKGAAYNVYIGYDDLYVKNGYCRNPCSNTARPTGCRKP